MRTNYINLTQMKVDLLSMYFYKFSVKFSKRFELEFKKISKNDNLDYLEKQNRPFHEIFRKRNFRLHRYDFYSVVNIVEECNKSEKKTNNSKYIYLDFKITSSSIYHFKIEKEKIDWLIHETTCVPLIMLTSMYPKTRTDKNPKLSEKNISMKIQEVSTETAKELTKETTAKTYKKNKFNVIQKEGNIWRFSLTDSTKDLVIKDSNGVHYLSVIFKLFNIKESRMISVMEIWSEVFDDVGEYHIKELKPKIRRDCQHVIKIFRKKYSESAPKFIDDLDKIDFAHRDAEYIHLLSNFSYSFKKYKFPPIDKPKTRNRAQN